MLTIIRLERDQDLPKATAELLDCLLSPDGDHPPDALLNFLHALRSGTSGMPLFSNRGSYMFSHTHVLV